LSKYALRDHITAIINVQGHIYLMTQYMKGPETTVLNSVFVHTQYLLTLFSSMQDAKQDMHIQEQSEL